MVAATSITCPISVLDLDHREAELGARVVEMADGISYNLGYINVTSGAAEALLTRRLLAPPSSESSLAGAL